VKLEEVGSVANFCFIRRCQFLLNAAKVAVPPFSIQAL